MSDQKTIQKEQLLVISALGSDQPGIVNELSRVCTDYGCNIVDSRMAVLGGEFAVIMLVSGSWDVIAKLEDAIPAAARKLNLNTLVKRTERPEQEQRIPYEVSVVALDHPGIVHEISRFFAERRINIESLETSTYAAPHTGTTMFSLNMTVNIPADTSIGRLREEFLMFCDDLNLDAVLEPARPY
ncbi:glycine cleavage system protein R [Hahella sp. SMD15-11]|uniref:Glycine cleavage system transcriptional repressor n=1 Tax=Thermohahella caldifontis TaxID=3142973 RepID=A0AB39UWB3_9GAMM